MPSGAFVRRTDGSLFLIDLSLPGSQVKPVWIPGKNKDPIVDCGWLTRSRLILLTRSGELNVVDPYVSNGVKVTNTIYLNDSLNESISWSTASIITGQDYLTGGSPFVYVTDRNHIVKIDVDTDLELQVYGKRYWPEAGDNAVTLLARSGGKPLPGTTRNHFIRCRDTGSALVYAEVDTRFDRALSTNPNVMVQHLRTVPHRDREEADHYPLIGPCLPRVNGQGLDSLVIYKTGLWAIPLIADHNAPSQLLFTPEEGLQLCSIDCRDNRMCVATEDEQGNGSIDLLNLSNRGQLVWRFEMNEPPQDMVLLSEPARNRVRAVVVTDGGAVHAYTVNWPNLVTNTQGSTPNLSGPSEAPSRAIRSIDLD